MKKKFPEVSIIIAYYKKKLFFKETINSILKQTYSNFEVIVIYDDEDRNELSFIKQSLKILPHYRIITNKKNIGAGLSRNKGIRFANGKYIAFCDADGFGSSYRLCISCK